MFYTAQCRSCKLVVACSKSKEVVHGWLDQGFVVKRTDFTDIEPQAPVTTAKNHVCK